MEGGLFNVTFFLFSKVERSPMHEERSQEKKKAPAPQQPPSQSDFVVVGAPWEKE